MYLFQQLFGILVNIYVIDNQDVTLLSFALDTNDTPEWVTKGAFSTLMFDSTQQLVMDLRRVAQDLVAEYHLKANAQLKTGFYDYVKLWFFYLSFLVFKSLCLKLSTISTVLIISYINSTYQKEIQLPQD